MEFSFEILNVVTFFPLQKKNHFSHMHVFTFFFSFFFQIIKTKKKTISLIYLSLFIQKNLKMQQQQ